MQVTWIPEEFAKVGKILKLKEGFLDEPDGNSRKENEMEKPKGVRGIGISLGEMERVLKGPCLDPEYLRLLLEAAVEKLHCLREVLETRALWSPGFAQVFERQEWVPSCQAPLSTGEAAAILEAALDAVYHYGQAAPGSFGDRANHDSAAYALDALEGGETDIEKLSATIHEGWMHAFRTFEDPVYATKPEKRVARAKLAVPYSELLDEEKQKDRIVAHVLLAEFRKRGGGQGEAK